MLLASFFMTNSVFFLSQTNSVFSLIADILLVTTT